MRAAVFLITAFCAGFCAAPALGQSAAPVADGPIHQLRIYQLLDGPKLRSTSGFAMTARAS